MPVTMIFALVLTALMLLASITDITRYIIPNWLNATLVLMYPVFVFLTPVPLDWKWALLIAVGTFVAGTVLFLLRALGGGDVKLLAAAMLYVGAPEALDLVFGTAIFGGLLSVFLLLARPSIRYMAASMKHPPKIPALLSPGEPMAYGPAIAAAFLLLLWSGKIPGIVLHF